MVGVVTTDNALREVTAEIDLAAGERLVRALVEGQVDERLLPRNDEGLSW